MAEKAWKDMTEEEKTLAVREKVCRYYGVEPRETTPEDVERLNAMLTLWRAQQQKAKQSGKPEDGTTPIV